MLACVSLIAFVFQSFLPFANFGSAAEPLPAERILELRSVFRIAQHIHVSMVCIWPDSLAVTHIHRETVRGMFYHAYNNYMEVILFGKSSCYGHFSIPIVAL